MSIHFLAFSIRSRSRSRFVAALGCSIFERNNLTEIWTLHPRDAPHGQAICIIGYDQQKVGRAYPVLGVIYKEWARKGDQVEQTSGIRMENHTSQGVPSGSAASNLMPKCTIGARLSLWWRKV